MKHLLLTILLPLTALALDPSQPVVRIAGGEIVERRQAIPNRYAGNGTLTVNYQSAGDEQWWRDGWRQAAITTVTNVSTVEIPAPIQAVASAYKAALEGIYGAGAVSNTNLTREAVAIDLSLNTNITADTGLRLSTWFEILDGYWQRGEVWTFPYDAASYSTTNISEVWEAVP
jgi:hypothetical protein